MKPSRIRGKKATCGPAVIASILNITTGRAEKLLKKQRKTKNPIESCYSEEVFFILKSKVNLDLDLFCPPDSTDVQVREFLEKTKRDIPLLLHMYYKPTSIGHLMVLVEETIFDSNNYKGVNWKDISFTDCYLISSARILNKAGTK